MDSFEMPYGDSDVKRVLSRQLAEELASQMARLRSELMDRIVEAVGAVAQPGHDTRLACLTLFVKENNASPTQCVASLAEIDALAQYVLTGKKPGADIVQSDHGVMGLDGAWVKKPGEA